MRNVLQKIESYLIAKRVSHDAILRHVNFLLDEVLLVSQTISSVLIGK